MGFDELFGTVRTKPAPKPTPTEPPIDDDSAATQTAKCASCGANMVYDPVSRAMKCPYCGTTQAIHAERSEEVDLAKLFATRVNEWSAETKVFRCVNCGAVTVIGKTEISKACAYCGASNIVESAELSGMRPDAVLPFLVSKEDAEQAVSLWAKKKKFTPNAFKKSVSPESINGHYIPAFTFDSDTVSRYRGTLGEYYYETRVVNGKEERVRKTRYFHISGNYSKFFDDVLVQASDRVSQATVSKLSPFDTGNAQKYTAEFLHGFSATQYVREGGACWGTAKKMMYDVVKREILARYTYDVIAEFHMDTQYNNVTYKYLLLPLYIGRFAFKKKLYNFFVNGRNGKVDGSVPRSPLKILALVAGILAVIAAIVVIYLYTSGGN